MEAEKNGKARYARSLIEASLDPLIVISTEGIITDMNEALATITGTTRENLIGSEFVIYFTDPQKANEIYHEVFAKGFVKNYPLTIIDGVLTDVLFNGSVYKDAEGQVLGAVVVARVITEQKRIEKELIEAKELAVREKENAEKEKRGAEKAAQIAEDAMRSKQQFLSNMSHEIRTPMNAIIGFTKVVLKTPLSEKQKEYLMAIKISGDSLIVLINDILDLAKVDAGKMTFEQTPFKMALSISMILHLFGPKIQEKNLMLVEEYDNKIPEVLLGDPIRLHQIMLNLLSNAVKFTEKGKITVGVRLLNDNEKNVTLEFSVTDTGIGVPENERERIFENFQQASSEIATVYGGTGLGLAITKQLVELQGGSVHVESKVNEGSTFSFKLSFEKTNAEAEFETEKVEAVRSRKEIRVLVVEDSPLNQLLVKTLLDDFGFESDMAANGKIAIEKLSEKNSNGKTKPFDIILMDLQMPVMNGFEATRYIRDKMNSDIPIIALTADVTTIGLAECNGFGMNEYISKPVDENLLYTKIVGLVKDSGSMAKGISPKGHKTVQGNGESKKMKCTDLAYLRQRTKSNPALMMEIISLYLIQTPLLINAMKKGLDDADWSTLYSAVHKLIPSFIVMGINNDFEVMAKKVQEYASARQHEATMPEMISQLDTVCLQACKELEQDFITIKNDNHEK